MLGNDDLHRYDRSLFLSLHSYVLCDHLFYEMKQGIEEKGLVDPDYQFASEKFQKPDI